MVNVVPRVKTLQPIQIDTETLTAVRQKIWELTVGNEFNRGLQQVTPIIALQQQQEHAVAIEQQQAEAQLPVKRAKESPIQPITQKRIKVEGTSIEPETPDLPEMQQPVLAFERAQALLNHQQSTVHNQTANTMETDPAQSTQLLVQHVSLQAPPSPYLTQDQYNLLTPEEQQAYYNQMHEYCMWREAMKNAGMDEMMQVAAVPHHNQQV